MEIIKGWRVVRIVKTSAGRDKLERVSRTFGSREVALTYAKLCGGGAYVQTVRAYAKAADAPLC